NGIRLNQDPSRQLSQILRLHQDRIPPLDTVWSVVAHDGQSFLVRHQTEAVLTVEIAACTLVGRSENYRCSRNRPVISIGDANAYRHCSAPADNVLTSVALHNLKSQPYSGLRQRELRDEHKTHNTGDALM